MLYLKRNDDGSFTDFATVEDLENDFGQDYDIKPSHLSWDEYLPQYAHLKPGDVLYIQSQKPSTSKSDPDNDEFERRVSRYQGGFEDASNDPDFWINL